MEDFRLLKELPTEKAILHDRIQQNQQLDSEVDPPYQPLGEQNDLPVLQIGRYVELDQKVCVTNDLKIIKGYLSADKEPPCFLSAGPRRFLYYPENVKVGIVTSGGVAPGLNTVIHGIVNMHAIYSKGKGFVHGFKDGFDGLIRCRFRELRSVVTRNWIHKGGTELGTVRRIIEMNDFSKMVKTLIKKEINIVYVVGGNGSMACAHELAKYIKTNQIKVRGQKVVVVGIPKTIDNDILWVDRSFGFETAVEEATKMICTIHDETESTHRICLMQVFGRGAGFVAAHAALASGVAKVVLIPEGKFELEPLLKRVERVVRTSKHAVVIIAEGAAVKEYNEQEWVRKKLNDQTIDLDDKQTSSRPDVNKARAEGKIEFLEEKFTERFFTGTKASPAVLKGRHFVFTSIPRHLVRAVPANAVDQVYCRRLADLAVHNALAGFNDFMVSRWLGEYVLVPLKLVAEEKDPLTGKPGLTKMIPLDGTLWKSVVNDTGQHYNLLYY